MKQILICLAIICASLQSFAIGAITGTLNVCVGATTALSDATPGGIWSSHNLTIATVGSSTGIVTGVNAGVVNITYTTSTDSVYATVTVNPLPALFITSFTPAICDSSLFSFIPASTLTGTAFSWSRAFVAGISNPPASGTGSISETLFNNTNTSLSVIYVYTLTATSCTSTQNVIVTVNPTPRVSSSLSPPAICDSTIFNYTPTSFVAGTLFSWDRPVITGIAESSATGTGNPNEKLIDTSVNPVAVAYTFTLTANGCTHTQTVTVTVNPTPKLSSPLTMPTICDTAAVSYVPASTTPGATFTWDRPAATGILPPNSLGIGNIHERLTDTMNIPETVTYYFRLGINGCTNSFTQTVTVVIDTCGTTSVNILNPAGPICIVPNPASDAVTISGIEGADNVVLYNTLGNVLFSQKGNIPGKLKINLSAFPAGMYFILATGRHGSFTGKVIKQ